MVAIRGVLCGMLVVIPALAVIAYDQAAERRHAREEAIDNTSRLETQNGFGLKVKHGLDVTAADLRISRAHTCALNLDAHLVRAIRAHANFAEHAPTVLLLIVVMAMLGFERVWLHVFGATFTIGRVIGAFGMPYERRLRVHPE